jgi:hypothetical protein
MIPGIQMFYWQMLADRELMAFAKPIADCLDALDLEGDGSPDAAGLSAVIDFIICHKEHSLREKLEKYHWLINLKGRQVGTPREITGW